MFKRKEDNKVNQILVKEKVYVTPELRRKKRLYKIEFFISVLLVCLLSSYYIYAEYDRNKTEEVSQAILAQAQDETTKTSEDDPIIIVLNEEEANEAEEETDIEVEDTSNKSITVDGQNYSVDAFITIPKIGISYPVLSETSDELLEVSVNRYWPEVGKLMPNEVGNYCIVGHNYRNGKMFGRLNELEDGDIVELQDLTGRTVKYKVYYTYVVEPTDTSCTSQLTEDGRPLNFRELTLITCTNYGTQRLVVKCREV